MQITSPPPWGPQPPPPTPAGGPLSPLGSPPLLLSAPRDTFPRPQTSSNLPVPFLGHTFRCNHRPVLPARLWKEPCVPLRFPMYSLSQALCLVQPTFHSCHIMPPDSSKSPMTSVSPNPEDSFCSGAVGLSHPLTPPSAACLESLRSGCLSPPPAPPGHLSCLSLLVLPSPRPPGPQPGRGF